MNFKFQLLLIIIFFVPIIGQSLELTETATIDLLSRKFIKDPAFIEWKVSEKGKKEKMKFQELNDRGYRELKSSLQVIKSFLKAGKKVQIDEPLTPRAFQKASNELSATWPKSAQEYLVSMSENAARCEWKLEKVITAEGILTFRDTNRSHDYEEQNERLGSEYQQ